MAAKNSSSGRRGPKGPIDKIIGARKVRTPVVFVSTPEEGRTEALIVAALTDAGLAKKVYRWDLRGVLKDLTAPADSASTEIKLSDASLTTAIQWYLTEPVFDNKDTRGGSMVKKLREDDARSHQLSPSGPINDRSVLIVHDYTHLIFHRNGSGSPHSANQLVNRHIIEGLSSMRQAWRMIIIMSHAPDVPVELQHSSTFIQFPLPSNVELSALVQAQTQVKISIPTSEGPKSVPVIRLDTTEALAVATALQGLTAGEAENALRMANITNANLWHESGCDRAFDPDTLREQKLTAIQRVSALELIEPKVTLEDVGGMELFKDHLVKVGLQMDPRARGEGLAHPKGFLFVGPGGTGKTLLAEALAAEWGLPTVALNIGRCKGQYVGQSENQLADALDRIRAMAPCVVIMDELEKAWAGASSSGATDSGVTAGMMAIFLRFMQEEREAPIINIGLCNSLEGLPSPVIRSGRFDVTTYIGLPGLAQRQEIMRIHMSRRTWNPGELEIDMTGLSKMMVGFSGSEIEQAVINGIQNKLARAGFGRTPSCRLEMCDLATGIRSVVPSFRTHREEYNRLRRWVSESGVLKASEDDDTGVDYSQSAVDAGPEQLTV